jgi:DNA-binding MarR family transcriptional regulator
VLHVATEKGREWVERRRQEVEAALAEALDSFSTNDRASVQRLIAKLNDGLRAAGSKRPALSAALLATR